MHGISVVITFFNSSEFLLPAILEPINNPHVDEVIIINDGSSPSETSELFNIVNSVKTGSTATFVNPKTESSKKFQLVMFVAGLLGIRKGAQDDSHDFLITGDSSKVRVVNLIENIGAFRAKHLAVEHARNDFVLLLDGDNFVLESTLANLALEPKSENEILCPNIQIMNSSDLARWDSRNFREFGFKPLNFNDLTSKATDPASESNILKILNTGNFLVPRKKYLEISSKAEILANLVGAQDVMLLTLSWLMEGNTLRVLPGFHYFHRLNSRSFWRTNRQPRLTLSQLINELELLE
jgi:glycosyltransferase involved in cell wall biosynthesis